MSPRGGEAAVVVVLLVLLLLYGQSLLCDEGGWVRHYRRGPEICRARVWSRMGCEVVSRGQLPKRSMSARAGRGWLWLVNVAGPGGELCGPQLRDGG